MKLLTFAGFAGAAAAGFFAAKTLLEREDLLDRVPAPARPPIAAARARLLAARRRASTVVAEAKRERDAAEIELTADYYRRVGRPVPTGLGGAAPAASQRQPVWRPGDPI